MSSASSLLDPAALARRYAMASELRAIDISVTAVTVFIVLLRLWARSKSTAGFGWDDWLIITGTVVMFGNLAMNLIMIENGLGLHAADVRISELIMIGKSIYADEIIYVINLALIKLSILVMYERIFDLPNFRIGAWILSSMKIVWSSMFIFICIFQCTPIPRAWNPTIPGKCLYLRGIFIGNSVPNIVTDVAILLMPLCHVWKLHVQFLQRVTLTFIFSLGCFVIFASIYRFVTVLQLDQNNIAYTRWTPTTWSHTEVCTAIISACLPCMRPLLTSYRRAMGRKNPERPRHTESRGVEHGWNARRVRHDVDLGLQGENEEFGDEEDQWSTEKRKDSEGNSSPTSDIRVMTRVDPYVKDG